MWKITVTLLLTCCLEAALAQNQGRATDSEHRRSIWEDPIQFYTKGTKDECYMSVTGQGDVTRLRITCRGQESSYWCEYQGKPQVCRSYNNNPRHYFTQIMWDLRKLPNACQGQRVIKPLMCKRASDEAQMVFATSSSADIGSRYRYLIRPEQMRPQQGRREQWGPKPTRPKAVKSTTQRKILTPKPTTPIPTTPAPPSEAKRLAKDHCWRSLQGVCSYIIGWFRN